MQNYIITYMKKCMPFLFLPERRMISSTSKATRGSITSRTVTVTRQKDAAFFIDLFIRQTLLNRAAKVRLNPMGYHPRCSHACNRRTWANVCQLIHILVGIVHPPKVLVYCQYGYFLITAFVILLDNRVPMIS